MNTEIQMLTFHFHTLQHANSPEMDLLLTLSVYLMLGCLGLLTSFSIVVCAFRLCLCSPAYRYVVRESDYLHNVNGRDFECYSYSDRVSLRLDARMNVTGLVSMGQSRIRSPNANVL